MIKSLTNKKLWPSKSNWIDQNNIVVGYDDYQQCCESFGWGVYNKDTNELVAEDPAGLPYHFGEECDLGGFVNLKDVYEEYYDIDQIELLPDDGKSPILILEFYNCHNGYYSHDFSITKVEVAGNGE